MAKIKLLDHNGLMLTEAHLPDDLFIDDLSGIVRHCETRSEALVSGIAATFEASDGKGAVLTGPVKLKSHANDLGLYGEVVLDRLYIGIGAVVTIQVRMRSVRELAA